MENETSTSTAPPPAAPPPPSTIAASTAARIAAEAAGIAVMHAAQNAAKKGSATSELKVTIVGIAAAGLVAGVEALKHVGGPLSLLATGLSMLLPVVGYQVTRAHVKSSALKAAAAAILVNSPAAEVDQ